MKIKKIIIISSLLLVGCMGEEFQDLRDFVKNSGADMRGKIPPAPDVKPYEPFVYDNLGSISDPFKPRKPDLRAGGKLGLNQPDLDRPKEALEEFPLEALKMVGFMQQKKVGYAIVKAPDSKIYRVKSANYLGLNFGKVLEVTGNEVKIKEMIQDSAGDWTERMSTLQLVE
jgi:type IV pilus assembly protein PilP